MPKGSFSPREMGFYFALAQVGVEMVAPIGVGLVLDYYLHWTPWGVVVGAVLGFVGGLMHLVALLNREDKSGPSQSGGDDS